MFFGSHSDRLARPTGKTIRPPRESLRPDFTSGEAKRREREGRRQVWPGSSGHPEILVQSKRRSLSADCHPRPANPPPYGVGAGSPSVRQTGRKFTSISNDIARTPMRLTDAVSDSGMRSPNRRYANAPRDNLASVFLPPTNGPARPSARSKSCPPLSREFSYVSQKATSPLKTTSAIHTAGGAMAGDDRRWAKPGMRINQELKHAQSFAVSMQSHAELRPRSRSASPARVGEATPPAYASKRQFSAGTFCGNGTADAMTWNRAQVSQFARKNRSHQQSPMVHDALTGRGVLDPIKGKKGVLGHHLTYKSHAVTIPTSLPRAPPSPSKGRPNGALWAHTRLW